MLHRTPYSGNKFKFLKYKGTKRGENVVDFGGFLVFFCRLKNLKFNVR